MPFDWPAFLNQNNIPYETAGKNVSSGNISTHCIWCGAADESMHLSVSLDGHGFRCWRRPEHRGKNPAKLIQALLNCSWERANVLAGNNTFLPDNFMSKIRSNLQVTVPIQIQNSKLALPKEFKPFRDVPSAKHFIQYLRGRDFSDSDIFDATENYQIYYCTQGPYRGRIIFTVYFEGCLCVWTGRTIYAAQELRYKTLSSDKEKAYQEGSPPARIPISHYLLWYDKCRDADADTVMLCEGPFDAFRVNVLGREYGIVATCFFTSSLSQAQINLLHELLPRFKRRILLLDQNTMPNMLRLRADLMSLGVQVKHLPQDIKDPGEIPDSKRLLEVLK